MEKTQKSRDRYRLTSEEVCAVFEVESFEFENTEKLDPLEGVIGQDRAVHAIQFGLGMSSFGYNIYAAGIPGTGKKSLIRSFVKRLAAERETPPDIFYVHNFQQPDHPQAIQVPSGVGSEFKRDMEECVLDLKREIPKIFQSGDYQKQQDETVQAFRQKRTELIERVQAEAKQRELLIKGEGAQILTVPLREGKEMSPAEFETLSPEQQKEIRQAQEQLTNMVQEIHREIQDIQQKTQQQVKELNRRVALIALGYLLDNLPTGTGPIRGLLTIWQRFRRTF